MLRSTHQDPSDDERKESVQAEPCIMEKEADATGVGEIMSLKGCLQDAMKFWSLRTKFKINSTPYAVRTADILQHLKMIYAHVASIMLRPVVR